MLSPNPARPDFSGHWRFRADLSALEIGLPDAVVLTIDHEEPRFHLERTLTFGGRTDTFAIDLRVGTGQPPLERGDATLHPALEWDRDELVFRTRIVRPEEEAMNVVCYHLEDHGTVLVADERFDSASRSYKNRWVFEKSESGPQPQQT
jgi:hypothetical protein